MALSANSQPHFTTIADFISRSSEEISQLFLQVLMICDEQKLIGREMFAIDGCKLPPRFKDYKCHDRYPKKEKSEQASEPNKFTDLGDFFEFNIHETTPNR